VIKAAFTKDLVKNGPRIDPDAGAITAAQEQELYRYYGLDDRQFSGESTLSRTAAARARQIARCEMG